MTYQQDWKLSEPPEKQKVRPGPKVDSEKKTELQILVGDAQKAGMKSQRDITNWINDKKGKKFTNQSAVSRCLAPPDESQTEMELEGDES